MPTNAYGQPIGDVVPSWTTRPRPPREAMAGRFCSVEPLDPKRHGSDLWRYLCVEGNPRNWTYLPYGPFDDEAVFQAWLAERALSEDPLFHAVLDASGRAAGLASYLRIEPVNGAIEVGHIHFAPLLQHTATTTEALYLFMRRAFAELGYRRFEWKCDSLNLPSRQAALRLGLVFEGIFQQATVVKGRNRDTAWFSATDGEWPRLAAAFEAWLEPANFIDGRQIGRLEDLRSKFS